MLDLAGIMFSSCLMLFVIVRAVQLDRVVPWFQRLTATATDKPSAKPQPAWGQRESPEQGSWRNRG